MKKRCAVLAAVVTALTLAATGLEAQPAPEIQQAMGSLQTGDLAGAVEVLEPLTQREPENGQAWSLLGFSYRGLQRVDDALSAYRRAVELPGSGPGARFNLGVTLAMKGEVDEAFDWIEKARDSGSFDVTQVDFSPAAATLREHPRYRSLFPSDEAFAQPFVEPTRIIHEWRGENVSDQFGWIARDIGDVDGDGIRDVTTSAPSLQIDGRAAGRVYAYSGRTGALLWTADGEPGDQLGLGIEAAGDVDADGVPDVIAGSPAAGKAVIFSGRDGRVIRTLTALDSGEAFGANVADLGDVDGDGHAEVIVGAPQNAAGGQAAGRAYVFSGRTGEPILTLTGEEAGDNFGNSTGGHVAADGRVTIVVGAPNAGAGDRGATYVFHGLTPEPAFVIESDEAGAQLGGMFVSAVGDVDGDGVVDVYAADWSASANGAGSGRAYVHSGADGRRLYDLHGEAAGDGFGIGVADVGDVDGDGHDDLLIGAWQHASAAVSGGKLYLYSGRDGALMRDITGRVPAETLGFDTTGVGDVDGDGVIDYLVTSAWSAINGGRSGRMFILSGVPDVHRE